MRKHNTGRGQPRIAPDKQQNGLDKRSDCHPVEPDLNPQGLAHDCFDKQQFMLRFDSKDLVGVDHRAREAFCGCVVYAF